MLTLRDLSLFMRGPVFFERSITYALSELAHLHQFRVTLLHHSHYDVLLSGFRPSHYLAFFNYITGQGFLLGDKFLGA